jgi:hypothetical protein
MELSLFKGYKVIQNEVQEFLKDFGFKTYKNSILYRTTDNDLLQFIDFQKGVSSLSNQMTINIVMQGLFVPGSSFDTLQPGNRIGIFTDEVKDKWWNCDNNEKAKEAADEIKTIFKQAVIPFFNAFENAGDIATLMKSTKYNFIWWIPTTFVDKGFFLLKARLYEEAVIWWEKHQLSKVPKFKTIKKLVQLQQYKEVDKVLEENCKLTRAKLKI